LLFENEKNQEDTETVIPEFIVGESGEHTPDLAEKQTQPPKYFTEAGLLRAMETAGKMVDDEDIRDAMKENGIGRPSTRANIIETLFKRRYIVRDKKRIIATPTGIELISAIDNELLKSAELTGRWERKMREIEKGTYEMSTFMVELRQMVADVVAQVKSAQRRSITIVEQDIKNEEKPKRKITKKTNK
jgi:DNA topoisomerase III